MTIFIFEDNILQSKFLKKTIDKILYYKHNESVNVVSLNKTEYLINNPNLFNFDNLNLYFLDIEMEDGLMSGFKLAQKIRSLDNKGIIVFVSTHSELILESYKQMVSALTFIEKNTDLDYFYFQVEQCLDYFIKKRKSTYTKEEYIVLNSSFIDIKIKINEIIFFETGDNHRIIVHEIGQDREFYSSLSKLEKLNKNFLRIHQSFLVNRLNILSINKANRELTLINKETVPISRKYYKNILKIFNNHMTDI
ncbi:LytR/AlgR family response regulator transcription factor [Vagococcus fluvialis]|uniref:LytR/AlgR family response regulator transcription factor n=1 Tax=Vagococcus fluvialis TaxID=2738 RepID=UPI00203330AF|nr:LytTR family DNA-binding domain-containing protein [Vagococcus fluvialis]MCM2139851.1 LytTR family DNA-binding domain-containing protein [Vagococcus fluvialis]URZ88912.1 FsrA-like DNA-binding response regulator [Vagococcus fluvialis]